MNLFNTRGRGSAALRSVLAVAMAVVLLTVALPAPAGHGGSGTITVCSLGCDFASIQAAIDHASPGDTILIGAGIYDQTFTVPSSTSDLTLCQSNGAGDACEATPDPALVVIDATSLGVEDAVVNDATGTTLKGLTVRNLPGPSSPNMVSAVRLRGAYGGFTLETSSLVASEMGLKGVGDSLSLPESPGPVVRDSVLEGETEFGLVLDGVSHATVEDTTLIGGIAGLWSEDRAESNALLDVDYQGDTYGAVVCGNFGYTLRGGTVAGASDAGVLAVRCDHETAANLDPSLVLEELVFESTPTTLELAGALPDMTVAAEETDWGVHTCDAIRASWVGVDAGDVVDFQPFIDENGDLAFCNLPPVFDPPLDDGTVTEGENINFIVRAEDPEGEPVTLSASGVPAGATFDPATGEFDWTPGFDQAGTHTVTFSASDGVNTATDPMTITVLDEDAVPNVEVLPPDHVSQKPDLVVVGETVRLQGRASVAEGSIVSAVFEKDGPGSTSLAATNVEGDLWQTAEVSYATTGEKLLVFTVEDSSGTVVQATRTIEVVDPEAPVALFEEDPIVVDGVLPTVSADGSPSFDALGRPLTFSYAFSDGTVVSFGGVQVWKVPPVGWSPPGAGAHDVTLTVTNDLGLSDSTTADILVDDALGVEASATPGEPGVGDAVNITGLVVDEAGAPRGGVGVKATVTHVLTGRQRSVFGTAAADGTFDLGLPYDVFAAGVVGVNLAGQHAVVVEASAANVFDFEDEPGPTETGETSFTYFVPAL